jgi:LacI family gluconate utilization system Gnt-I transcriptional repressor
MGVIGFGGLHFTEHTYPQLSSVAVDREGIGRTAGRLLVDRLENRAAPGAVIDLGFRILERGTT